MKMTRVPVALFALSIVMALSSCARQAERLREQPPTAVEHGAALGLRLAVAPPINKTALPEASKWANEALLTALGELTAFRLKRPEEIGSIFRRESVANALERFASAPDDTALMLAAALAVGKAAGADYVMLETLDGLAHYSSPDANFPTLVATCRIYLVAYPSGRIAFSQGYAGRVDTRTDEAEPAIRDVLLKTSRELVGRMPWPRE